MYYQDTNTSGGRVVEVRVPVPGPTVTKEIRVPVPGPERVVVKEVPGPERIVPGPERVVVKEVVKTVEVPGKCEDPGPKPDPDPRPDPEPDPSPDPDPDPVDPKKEEKTKETQEALCEFATQLKGNSEEYCNRAGLLLQACKARTPQAGAILAAVRSYQPQLVADYAILTYQVALAAAIETLGIATTFSWWKKSASGQALLNAVGRPEDMAAILTAIALHESGDKLNPNARNPAGTAAGYWQFLKTTRDGLRTKYDNALPAWPVTAKGEENPISVCDQGNYAGVFTLRILVNLGTRFGVKGGALVGKNADAEAKLANINKALVAKGINAASTSQVQAAIYAYWGVGSGAGAAKDPQWAKVAIRAANAVHVADEIVAGRLTLDVAT